MTRPPFVVSLILSLACIVGCVYFWFVSDNPGRLVASAFLLIGLAQFGTHTVMDIVRMRKAT